MTTTPTTPAKSDAQLLYDAFRNDWFAHDIPYVGDGDDLTMVMIDGWTDFERIAAEFLRLRAEQEAAR